MRRLVIDHGMSVFATARRLDRLGELRAELPAGTVHVLDGDIADAAFRERLWTWAEAESGGIDLLINNAGVGHYADFGEQPMDDVRRIIEVNVMALFDLTQRAIRAMRGRGFGEIVEISSVLGTFGIPYSAVYVASKHAVDGLVKSVRHELRDSGVKLWAARPGRFASEFRRVSSKGLGHDDPRERSPVEKVAKGVLKGIGRGRGFVSPTLSSALTIAAAHWLPGPFDALIGWLGPKKFAKDFGEAVRPKNSSAP